MRNILIIGANRGLGQSLASQYAGAGKHVYATARYSVPHTADSNANLTWIPNVDITQEKAGHRIALQWHSSLSKIDLLIVCAGYFAKETLKDLNFDKQVSMYKTVAIGPVFLVQSLVSEGLLAKGSRVILVGGESGSVALRHKSEGGGNYGGHGSKAALNMMGKLLSIDLRDQGVAVAIVHTGYLRKENKDGFFEAGGKDGES